MWEGVLTVLIVGAALVLMVYSLRRTLTRGVAACECSRAGGCQGGSGSCGHAAAGGVGKHGH